jgi:hypothetical protein
LLRTPQPSVDDEEHGIEYDLGVSDEQTTYASWNQLDEMQELDHPEFGFEDQIIIEPLPVDDLDRSEEMLATSLAQPIGEAPQPPRPTQPPTIHQPILPRNDNDQTQEEVIPDPTQTKSSRPTYQKGNRKRTVCQICKRIKVIVHKRTGTKIPHQCPDEIDHGNNEVSVKHFENQKTKLMVPYNARHQSSGAETTGASALEDDIDQALAEETDNVLYATLPDPSTFENENNDDDDDDKIDILEDDIDDILAEGESILGAQLVELHTLEKQCDDDDYDEKVGEKSQNNDKDESKFKEDKDKDNNNNDEDDENENEFKGIEKYAV